MWIPYLRWCHIDEDRVEITAPLLFGRGFVFDGSTQVVIIRRRLLGISLSEEKVPFIDVNLTAHAETIEETRGFGSFLGQRIDYKVAMEWWGTDRTLMVCQATEDKTRRIVAAINRLQRDMPEMHLNF